MVIQLKTDSSKCSNLSSRYCMYCMRLWSCSGLQFSFKDQTTNSYHLPCLFYLGLPRIVRYTKTILCLAVAKVVKLVYKQCQERTKGCSGLVLQLLIVKTQQGFSLVRKSKHLFRSLFSYFSTSKKQTSINKTSDIDRLRHTHDDGKKKIYTWHPRFNLYR